MATSWVELSFTRGIAQADTVELRLSNDSLALDSEFGSMSLVDAGVCGVGRGITVWRNESTKVAVVGAQLADVLYTLALQSDQIVGENLFRDEEPDLRFLSIRPAVESSLIVLYERGLVLLREDGTVSWHRLHDDLSAHVAELSAEEVVLETQWPAELAGERTRYRLADGEILTSTYGLPRTAATTGASEAVTSASDFGELDAWIAAIGSVDRDRARRAMDRLRAGGAQTMARLMSVLDESAPITFEEGIDPRDRIELCLDVLADLAENDPGTFVEVARAGGHTKSVGATWVLQRVSDPAAVDLLLEALTADDPNVRWSAIKALEGRQETRVLDALIEALFDDDSFVRSAAVFAVAALKDPRTVDALTAVVNDNRNVDAPGIVERAQQALSDIHAK